MTFEELIGSRLVFGIPGTTITPEIVRHFKETHAGGLILYRINFESPDQTRKLISDLENALERRLHLLFVLFQMTCLGAPMVYYGDEAGLYGANDPCCRKPMLWPGLHYDAEAIGPDGKPRAEPQAIGFDRALHDEYRRLIALRHALPALRTGAVRTLLADDARQVLVHLRGDGALVAINRSEEMQVVELPWAAPAGWVDRLNGDAEVEVHDGRTRLALQPLWGAVLA